MIKVDPKTEEIKLTGTIENIVKEIGAAIGAFLFTVTEEADGDEEKINLVATMLSIELAGMLALTEDQFGVSINLLDTDDICKISVDEKELEKQINNLKKGDK